eukprot:15068290-Heterocapsa_arctica.AAC.1
MGTTRRATKLRPSVPGHHDAVVAAARRVSKCRDNIARNATSEGQAPGTQQGGDSQPPSSALGH